MNINKEVEKLETMLQTEENFSDIFQQFMVLVDSPKFMGLGKPKKNPMLKTIIMKAMEDIGLPEVSGIRIKFIRKFGFYHGSFMAGPMPGNIIYFGDIKMGLISIPRDFQGNNSFFRFSGTAVMTGGFTTGKQSEETH